MEVRIMSSKGGYFFSKKGNGIQALKYSFFSDTKF